MKKQKEATRVLTFVSFSSRVRVVRPGAAPVGKPKKACNPTDCEPSYRSQLAWPRVYRDQISGFACGLGPEVYAGIAKIASIAKKSKIEKNNHLKLKDPLAADLRR